MRGHHEKTDNDEGTARRFAERGGASHPVHIHGHTVQLGQAGPRKDTAIVLPGQTLACDFNADNPANGRSTATTPTTPKPAC